MLEDHRVREGNNRFSDDEGETKVTPDTTALSRMPARAKQGRVGEIDLSSSDDDWLAVCDGNGGLEDDGTEGERGTEGDTALVRAWYLWCGKPIRVFVGVRWSEFRCWFPEFLDCRSHELAYRAHSTFRAVPPEQGLNNATYLFSPEVTSSPTRGASLVLKSCITTDDTKRRIQRLLCSL